MSLCWLNGKHLENIWNWKPENLLPCVFPLQNKPWQPEAAGLQVHNLIWITLSPVPMGAGGSEEFGLSALITALEVYLNHIICPYTIKEKITWQQKIWENDDSKLSLVCVLISMLARDFLEQRILIFICIFFWTLSKQKLSSFWEAIWGNLRLLPDGAQSHGGGSDRRAGNGVGDKAAAAAGPRPQRLPQVLLSSAWGFWAALLCAWEVTPNR